MPFLLPYILSETQSTLKMVCLFLERNGTHLIEISDLEAAKEFLATNDIVVEQLHTVGDVIYASVSTDTDLDAFYTWKETPPGTTPTREVWRTFLWGQEPWGINRQMESIPIGPSHTVYSVLQGLP